MSGGFPILVGFVQWISALLRGERIGGRGLKQIGNLGLFCAPCIRGGRKFLGFFRGLGGGRCISYTS